MKIQRFESKKTGEKQLFKATIPIHVRLAMIFIAGALLGLFHRWMMLFELVDAGAAMSMYAGAMIPKGLYPYRDVWYNGMPGVALCNIPVAAWGRAGVFAMGALFTALAAVAVGGTIKRLTKNASDAVTGAALVMFATMGLMSFGGENSPYEWCLPAQGMCLYLIAEGQKSGRRGGAAALFAGISGGAATLFAPREAALLLLGLVSFNRHRFQYVAGFIFPPAIFRGLLVWKGALESFDFQVIEYYHTVASMKQGMSAGPNSMINILIVAAIMVPFIAGIMMFRKEENEKKDRGMKMFLILWTAYETAVFFASYGRTAQGLIPMMVPGAAMWGCFLKPSQIKITSWRGKALVAVSVVGFMALSVHAAEIIGVGEPHSHEHQHWKKGLPELTERIAGKGGGILVWGQSAETYLIAGKHASGKYATITPLFTKEYGERIIPEYIADLKSNPPELILLEMSLLSEGAMEKFHGENELWVGPAQIRLLQTMQKLIKEEYGILAVHEGIVFCGRKNRK